MIASIVLGFLPLIIDQQIERGEDVFSMIQGVAFAGQPDGATVDKQQEIETLVEDPNFPNEPWKVTTYRRPGESNTAFIGRHRDLVASIREALRQER